MSWGRRRRWLAVVCLLVSCATPPPRFPHDPHAPTVCAEAIAKNRPDARALCEGFWDLTGDAELVFLLAELDLRDGLRAQAIQRLRHAVERIRSNPGLHEALADLLELDGALEEAARHRARAGRLRAFGW